MAGELRSYMFDWPSEMKDSGPPGYVLFQYYCDYAAWDNWLRENAQGRTH